MMPAAKKSFFHLARPVWLAGLELEDNIHAGFRAAITAPPAGSTILRITGATHFRVFLDGHFIHHGPARGPHGYNRVDELNLTDRLTPDTQHLLAVEVASYTCASYAYPRQPGFLQAEIEAAGRVVSATGELSFAAKRLTGRVQKVERFSFQRPYAEAYRLAPDANNWRVDMNCPLEDTLVELPAKNLIPRRVALPDLRQTPDSLVLRGGTLQVNLDPVAHPREGQLSAEALVQLGSFAPDSFELDLRDIHQRCQCDTGGEGRYELRDLGANLTGFLEVDVICERHVRLLATFDEILTADDVDTKRGQTLGLLYFELEPGAHQLLSLEPYTFRYLKLAALDGGLTVLSARLREYANAEAVRVAFDCSDPELKELFEAGRQTFRQNAVDIYMDCPGRERAGWLCDSFFTGRTEPFLCGGSAIEHNFLENFALPESFAHLPDGMLPMCYPADHPNGQFIPQWSLWFILELEEYVDRTGDRDLPEALRQRIAALLDYFATFENADGLLEKLPSWNFIEWSKANRLMQDVSYPTNMLYARALNASAQLYQQPGWAEKAATINATVHRQSFQGLFFVDNALRDELGSLRLSGQSSEVCQYYAFFCGTASPDTHPELWTTLLNHFGPMRPPDAAHSEVHPANAFIGDYLRMDLLQRFGESKRLLKEMKAYFLCMARSTNTLWEHNNTRASCNHGFASYLCVLLIRSALGLLRVDRKARRILLRAPEIDLESCEVILPVADERLRLGWIIQDGKPEWRLDLPPGWKADFVSA